MQNIMKSRRFFPVLGIALLLGAAPAWSAESAIGRITYIYPSGHRIVLDSRDDYNFGAKH